MSLTSVSSSISPTLQLLDEGLPKPLKRRYPPVSSSDTFVGVDGKIESEHGRMLVFADKEIIQVHGDCIQQTGIRACTKGCVDILLNDHNKAVPKQALRRQNLGSIGSMVTDLTRAGATPIVTKVTKKTLKAQIQRGGSAIVSIHNQGLHSVVVDKITSAFVRLRDPYHGWDISVERSAFYQKFNCLVDFSEIIQLKRPRSQDRKEREPLRRRYPPVSSCDTVAPDSRGITGSQHGKIKVFNDSEIIKILGDCTLQQATRGCTIAAVDNLLRHYGSFVSPDELSERNLGSIEDMLDDLYNYSTCTPYVTRVTKKTLSGQIQKGGPAIVTINNGGSHVVVVTSIDLSEVILEDSYHGWKLSVRPEAFWKRFGWASINEIIQLKPSLPLEKPEAKHRE